ncbi:MAG: 2-hydroxyacid dehydrogenase [Parvibaculaceae bacterium]
MDILFLTHYPDYVDAPRWVRTLEAALPGVRVRLWPDIGEADGIALAVGDFAPEGLFASLKNLKCVMYVGAGVDAMFRDPQFPRHVPLVRSNDSAITFQVAQYVALHILDHHRHGAAYREQQRAKAWRPIPTQDTRSLTVGMVGFGRIGQKTSSILRALEFQVCSWSRSAESAAPDIPHATGRDGLGDMLASSDYVVSSLPLTRETRGIFNDSTLNSFKQGAVLVNVGRGSLVVDEDLLAALNSGRLGHAVLDVFNQEPLPADHPYWAHPRVTVTPHVANFWVDGSMTQIVDVWHRIRDGRPFEHIVDPDKGY